MKRVLLAILLILLVLFGWKIYIVDEAFSPECEGPGFDDLKNTTITSIKVIEYPELDPNSPLSEGLTITLEDDNMYRDDSFSLNIKFIHIDDEAIIREIKAFILEREGILEAQFFTVPHGAKDIEFLSNEEVVVSINYWGFFYKTSACHNGIISLDETESKYLNSLLDGKGM